MHQKGGTYYYVTSGTPRLWTKLERDYAIAIRLYAEIEGTAYPEHVATFRTIAARYRREVFPTKAFQTQRDNEKEMVNLEAVFGDLPISSIKPHHVRRYLDIRGLKAKVRANREKALLSHLFNHARQWGYTDAANPCAGVKGHKETGRDRYVDDSEFRAIWDKADFTVQDAMDILYCTAQRPSDVLHMKRSDIRNGELWIRQGKGGQKIRIEIGGVLEAVIERIFARAYPVTEASIVLPRSEVRETGALIQNEDGQALSYGQLRYRFNQARKAAKVSFQLRDIRAKSASDLEDLPHAQKLLAHKRRATTEHYAGRRKGQRVAPVNRVFDKEDANPEEGSVTEPV